MSRLTKRELARSLHDAGRTVEEIAAALHSEPGYIIAALEAQGKEPRVDALYVAQNDYARAFQGVLRFRDVESARASVDRLDALYHQYEAAGDRRGMHQALLMALIGRNRAEGTDRYREAELFARWLINHLDVKEGRL